MTGRARIGAWTPIDPGPHVAARAAYAPVTAAKSPQSTSTQIARMGARGDLRWPDKA